MPTCRHFARGSYKKIRNKDPCIIWEEFGSQSQDWQLTGDWVPETRRLVTYGETFVVNYGGTYSETFGVTYDVISGVLYWVTYGDTYDAICCGLSVWLTVGLRLTLDGLVFNLRWTYDFLRWTCGVTFRRLFEILYYWFHWFEIWYANIKNNSATFLFLWIVSILILEKSKISFFRKFPNLSPPRVLKLSPPLALVMKTRARKHCFLYE